MKNALLPKNPLFFLLHYKKIKNIIIDREKKWASGQVGRTVKFTICSRHSLVRTQPDDVYSRWPQYNTD